MKRASRARAAPESSRLAAKRAYVLKWTPAAKALGADAGLVIRSWQALEDAQRGDYSELLMLLREERALLPDLRAHIIAVLEGEHARKWHLARRFTLPMVRHIRQEFVMMTDPRCRNKAKSWAIAKLAEWHDCNASTIRDMIAGRKTFREK